MGENTRRFAGLAAGNRGSPLAVIFCMKPSLLLKLSGKEGSLVFARRETEIALVMRAEE